LSFVRTQHPGVLEAINASGAMSDESEKALTEAMNSFKSSYAYQA
jgi:ATP synthase subunit alpha